MATNFSNSAVSLSADVSIAIPIHTQENLAKTAADVTQPVLSSQLKQPGILIIT